MNQTTEDDMGGFVVQDNIPIAKKAVARQRSPLREALANLEVGQCVTVFPEPGQTMKALRARLSGLTQGAKQDNPEAHYVHRTVDAADPNEPDNAPVRKAIRIWRVTEDQADPHKGKPASRKKAASKKKAAVAAPPPRGQETGAEVPDANLTEPEPTREEPVRDPEPELTDAEASVEDQRAFEADVNEQLDAEQEEEDPDDPWGDDWDEEEEDGEWDEEGEEEEDPDLDRPATMPNL